MSIPVCGRWTEGARATVSTNSDGEIVLHLWDDDPSSMLVHLSPDMAAWVARLLTKAAS